MRRFFDIYIQASESPPAVFDPTADYALSSYDRLELPHREASITAEPITAELGDGCDLVDGESVIFQGGTYKVTKAEWEKLRTAYNGVVCDVVLWDPQDDTLILAAQGIRMAVIKLAGLGESVVIKLSGAKKKGVDTAGGAPFQIIDIVTDYTQYACLISGVIYDTDGVTPIAEVLVDLLEHAGGIISCTGLTDADGRYEIMAQAPETGTYLYDITVTKSGKTFPADETVTVRRNGEYKKDITATA